MPDIYFTGKNSINRFRGFKLYPEHAVRAINEGHGDIIQQSKVLNIDYTHVLYFLDRSIGEPLRQKTIEGWKNTKYKYGILYRHVIYDKNGRFYYDNQDLLFDTEEEAWAKIEEFSKDIIARNEEFEENPQAFENWVFPNELIAKCFYSSEGVSDILVQQIPLQ